MLADACVLALHVVGRQGGDALSWTSTSQRGQMRVTAEMRIREFARKIKYWRPRRARKLVLCRPRGGFNDVLCQIDRCRLYAIRNHRKLWVDTNRSGFHDCLSNYFEPSKGFHFGSPLPQIRDDASCFPTFLAHRLDSYESVYDPSLDNWADKETGEPLTFDFSSRYDETILLHEQCGGGDKSIMALALLRLKKDVRRKVRQVVESLGKYDAIHVRNTDLTTDYVTWFQRLHDEIDGKVVVCTDDSRCLQYARELWGQSLVEVHDVPDVSGAPLHSARSEDQRTLNVNVLIDLFVLASAERFHSTTTDQGKTSGFAELAESLRSNPRILKKSLS